MAPKRKGVIKEIHSGMGRQPNPLEGPETQSWGLGVGFPLPGLLERFPRPYQPELVLLSRQINSLSPQR